ncbi:MAG: hypothetical protein NZ483_02055 [Verrucomicrobiae bacterium]|nr:hypothetical protein [Verrucomicrobiae bacterium]
MNDAHTSRLPAILAGGWVILVAAVFWFRYDHWLLPLQFFHQLAISVPHLRIGPHSGEFWLERVLDAGWLVLLVGSAWPVGRLIVKPRDELEDWWALGLGLGIVSIATLLVASVSCRAVGVVFGFALLWMVPAVRRRPMPYMYPRGKEEWLLATVLVVTALINLPGAWVPPFEYDELEYHLGAPAEYVRVGRVVFLPHNFYSNLPQLTEMLYLLGLVTRSDIAAKWLHWLFGVLTIPVILCAASQLGLRRAGWWAATLFYAVPYAFDLSQTARVDLNTGFYGALALALWLAPHRDLKWAALAAGCAVGTKWTAIPVVLFPLLAMTAWRSQRVMPVVRVAGWSVLPVLPWLIKNALLAGNPVYPLFHSWLGGGQWSAEQAAVFAARHYPRWDAQGWWQLLERPWQYSFVEPGALPLLVAAIPLMWLAGGQRPLGCGGWFGLGFAGWFLTTYRPWRFLWPVMPAATLWVGESVAIAGRWVKVVLLLLIATGWCWSGLNLLMDCGEPDIKPPRLSFVQYVLGHADRTEFLRHVGGGVFDPIVWMNENLPADARVLYVGEARAYYARHAVLWSTAFDLHPLQKHALTELDVTHVYIHFAEWRRLARGYGYLQSVDMPSVLDYLQSHAREVYRTDRHVVYELASR